METRRIHIALDAMGGDHAPQETVAGALAAVEKNECLFVTLLGREEEILPLVSKEMLSGGRIRILDAREEIAVAEPPVHAVMTKQDSSLVKGMRLVKNGEADAFVSAGSSGAILAGGQLIVGRIKGIERPPLAAIMPSEKGPVLLLDCGANVDARASHLVQFAQMGSIYMENMTGIASPRVALYNIGEEEEKGNALVKEVYPALAALDNIRFIGNIEAREIPAGGADVVVCDAFVGNAILKMYEGVASVLLKEIKSSLTSTMRTKIGALLCKPGLKKMLQKFDTTAYGGAPLLGLRGLVVKAHGNSTRLEIENALTQCIRFSEKEINAQFQDRVNLTDRAAKRRQNAE